MTLFLFIPFTWQRIYPFFTKGLVYETLPSLGKCSMYSPPKKNLSWFLFHLYFHSTLYLTVLTVTKNYFIKLPIYFFLLENCDQIYMNSQFVFFWQVLLYSQSSKMNITLYKCIYKVSQRLQRLKGYYWISSARVRTLWSLQRSWKISKSSLYRHRGSVKV